MQIYYPWTYIYEWDTWSGTIIDWFNYINVLDPTCNNIMTELEQLKAPASYPVDCSFTELNSATNTGVVFFMDPNNQQLVQSIEVWIVSQQSIWFAYDDLIFIFSIMTGFITTFILFLTLIRQLKKISPKLF